MIVYHGSSNKNLRFNPKKPLMFFTTSKEDAKDWADRIILGGKRNKDSYVYTAELNFKKLYEEGDDFNPEYAEYEYSEEKGEIWSEIFFEDINERREELVKAGFDCFHIELSEGIEYYIVPYECRNIIKWKEKETLSENADVLEKPEILNKSNENFWKWFNGSKCVENDGTPKIVYHGSEANFNVFDKSLLGSATKRNLTDWHGEKMDCPSAYLGFFFTDDEDFAREYGDILYECYLKITNPLIVDMSEYMNNDEVLTQFINQAIKENKDGVVFKNIREIGRPVANEYVVFESNQIKEISNHGQWSNSDNIYEQLNKLFEELL